jgi:hypothetical protein
MMSPFSNHPFALGPMGRAGWAPALPAPGNCREEVYLYYSRREERKSIFKVDKRVLIGLRY